MMPENVNNLHAVQVVGAQPTGSDKIFGGLKLMIQDSNPDRPFVVAGLDLVRSMGVSMLFGIQAGLKFESGANNSEGDNGAWLSGGSSPAGYPRFGNDTSPSSPEEIDWITEVDALNPPVTLCGPPPN